MGAFHNQIRENETFESLLDLYGKALDDLRAEREDNARLRKALKEAQSSITAAWTSTQHQSMYAVREHLVKAHDALASAEGE